MNVETGDDVLRFCLHNVTAMPTLDRSTYTTMIRDMPEGERPRERLVQCGASALSNAELIAILLRTGATGESVVNMSNQLLSQYGGL